MMFWILFWAQSLSELHVVYVNLTGSDFIYTKRETENARESVEFMFICRALVESLDPKLVKPGMPLLGMIMHRIRAADFVLPASATSK